MFICLGNKRNILGGGGGRLYAQHAIQFSVQLPIRYCMSKQGLGDKHCSGTTTDWRYVKVKFLVSLSTNMKLKHHIPCEV